MLDRLRIVRENAKLTQSEVAAQLGISKQFYSQIERGDRRLNYEMAVAIAKIFKTTPDNIFLPNGYTISGQLPTGTDGR